VLVLYGPIGSASTFETSQPFFQGANAMIVDGKPHSQRRQPRGIEALRARRSSFQVLISRDSFSDSDPGRSALSCLGQSVTVTVLGTMRNPSQKFPDRLQSAARLSKIPPMQDVLWKPYIWSKVQSKPSRTSSPGTPCAGNCCRRQERSGIGSSSLYRASCHHQGYFHVRSGALVMGENWQKSTRKEGSPCYIAIESPL
jgi:hypothetical protein